MFTDIIQKTRLFFRKDKESYLVLYRILGFYPRTIQLYQQALLHKSSLAKCSDGKPLNNERLEFLGDAVLDIIVADLLYRYFPHKSEGFLTKTRSKIVKREMLNSLGKEIGLDKLVKSHHSAIETHNSYLCGNAFEAFMGAIYLDRGYEACYAFFLEKIQKPYLNFNRIAFKEENHKSKLLEWAQHYHVEILFELLDQTTDEANSQIFNSQVRLHGLEAAEGTGYTKKESHQKAAQKALKRLKKDQSFCEEVLKRAGYQTSKAEVE